MVAPLALAALCSASQWAETPELARKADGAQFSAIESSEEAFLRDFDDPSPRPDQRTPALPGQWRWFGSRLPALDPQEPAPSWSAGFGNELGDPLFRESTVDAPVNRNPALHLDASTPRLGDWRLGLLFDQVDHYSDRLIPVRNAILGSPRLEDADIPTRRSFFGENIPGHSFAGGGAASPGFGAAAKTGWIWLPSPGSRELQCWRATTASFRARIAAFEWRHAVGQFDRADRAEGSTRQSQGWISAGPAGDSLLSADAGFRYGAVERDGDVPWHPAERLDLAPWIALSGRFGSWKAGGFHEFGTDRFSLRDSLEWTGAAGPATPSLLLSGRWTDRPDGTAPWRDSSAAGIVHMDSRALEQTCRARLALRLSRGPLTLALSSSPWWVAHPRAFAPTAFDTLQKSGGVVWIARAGSERALPGVLWGWKQEATIAIAAASFLSFDAGAGFDPVLGGPSGETDLVAPLWTASIGAAFRHRSGFSCRPQLVWRDEAVLRHLAPDDWTVPSGFDANLWIEQDYFAGRLVLSMAALDVLSRDPIQTPDANVARARLLVRASGRLP